MRWISSNIAAVLFRLTLAAIIGGVFLVASFDPSAFMARLIDTPPEWVGHPLMQFGLAIIGFGIVIGVFFLDRAVRKRYHGREISVQTPYVRWQHSPKYTLEQAASIWSDTKDPNNNDRDLCFNRLKQAIRIQELSAQKLNGPKPNAKTVIQTSDLKDWFERKGLMPKVGSSETQFDGGSPIEDDEHQPIAVSPSDRPPPIPLDRSSLSAYIWGNPRVKRINKRLARDLGVEIDNSETGSLHLEEKAMSFGIDTISALDEALENSEEYIVQMSHYMRPEGNIDAGYCVGMLFNILGAQLGSVEKYSEHLNSLKHSGADRGWAKEIIHAYEQIKSYPIVGDDDSR